MRCDAVLKKRWGSDLNMVDLWTIIFYNDIITVVFVHRYKCSFSHVRDSTG